MKLEVRKQRIVNATKKIVDIESVLFSMEKNNLTELMFDIYKENHLKRKELVEYVEHL
jgi:hypothetical protein